MPFDPSLAEPAPTRRSSRQATTTAVAVERTAGLTRAELRRRAAAATGAVATPDAAPLRRRRVRTATLELTAVDAATAVDSSPVGKPVLETVPLEEPVAEALPSATPTAEPDVDEFERAAKLFQFTGETPVVDQKVEPAASVDEPISQLPAEAIGTAPVRARSTFRRAAAASFSFAVIGVVGLLGMGTAMPAEALAASAAGSSNAALSVVAPADDAVNAESEEIQAYVAPAGVEGQTIVRDDGYATTTVQQIAAETGIQYSSAVFTNDQNAAIQWPFAVGVAMSSGYGYRWGRLHEGLDFVPGAGAPIQAIADGVVRVATEGGGAYGVHVYIDHEIDGQVITSHYAHMQYGSLQVSPGQTITVGQIIGRTGNTGRSYGAHLHFELAVNGTTIDPLPWLRKYAGG